VDQVTYRNHLVTEIHNHAPLKVGQRDVSDHLDDAGIQDVRIYLTELTRPEVESVMRIPALTRSLAKIPALRTPKENGDLTTFLSLTDPELESYRLKGAARSAQFNGIQTNVPTTLIQEEKAGSKAMTRILLRGQYNQPGEAVEPG